MGSFFLLGCGGSKFTVAEDDLGLPKRDPRKGEKMRTKRENGTMMNGDLTSESHGNDNGSKETKTMPLQKQQQPLKEVPTYEVKLVNNRLVQQVTMTPVNGKNSTITRQGNKDSDFDDNYEDGSRISNFNDDDTFTRSPSFREYCNTNDSKFEGSDDKEIGIENDENVDKKTQTTKNENISSHVKDDISNDKKTGTADDEIVPHENEETRKNGSTHKDGLGIRLRKAFPIHMLQVVKLTNMRKKSSR